MNHGGSRPNTGKRGVGGLRVRRVSARLGQRASDGLDAYCRRHGMKPSDAINEILMQSGRARPVGGGRRS